MSMTSSWYHISSIYQSQFSTASTEPMTSLQSMRWNCCGCLWDVRITRFTVICNVSFWHYFLFSNQLEVENPEFKRKENIYTFPVPPSIQYRWPFFFETKVQLIGSCVKRHHFEKLFSLHIFLLKVIYFDINSQLLSLLLASAKKANTLQIR